MKLVFFSILLLFAYASPVFSQFQVKDSAVFAPLISGSYAYQIPGGDMAERFGANSSLGASFLFKTKSNWLFGIDGYFLFRDSVKENNILDGLKTKHGRIINKDGGYGEVNISERGYMFSGRFGKILPVFGPNPNSGLTFLGGVGFLQHKIRIADKDNNITQLKGDYVKGYDRLTNGLALTEFIGYYHFSNNRKVNFYFGFEFIQAFTKNRRAYNFDTMERDDKERLDLLYGIRFGWTFPIYKRAPQEYYYY